MEVREEGTGSTKFTEVDEDHVILIDLCPPYNINFYARKFQSFNNYLHMIITYTRSEL